MTSSFLPRGACLAAIIAAVMAQSACAFDACVLRPCGFCYDSAFSTAAPSSPSREVDPALAMQSAVPGAGVRH